MPTDAVVVLKDDHQKLRKLFDDFKTTGPNATVTKGKISKNIIEQLTIHTYLENEIMYPEVRTRKPELEGNVLEPYEEHHVGRCRGHGACRRET